MPSKDRYLIARVSAPARKEIAATAARHGGTTSDLVRAIPEVVRALESRAPGKTRKILVAGLESGVDLVQHAQAVVAPTVAPKRMRRRDE